jgi:hypothetical protein
MFNISEVYRTSEKIYKCNTYSMLQDLLKITPFLDNFRVDASLGSQGLLGFASSL